MKTALPRSPWLQPSRLRFLTQAALLIVCLYLGVRFGQFVRHFETFGATPAVPRPPGVEGFLPIGALVSLKHWLVNGVIDPVHPAALVLFVTFLALALLAKNAFCSWLCPVGTLSEWLWKGVHRLTGRTFRVWNWLDLPLRGLKYLLLAFFLKLIAIDMPAFALAEFLASPYWAIADVRMLHFFTAPSPLSLAIIGLLIGLSAVYRNAWCRYLCPYGALLGLLSLFSPLKVQRRREHCTDCRRCTAVCPARIEVHRKQTVRSLDCTGCLTCVGNCPAAGALELAPEFGRTGLPGWGFALLVVLLLAGGIATGMLTGHWGSALTYADYQQLIPIADRIGH
ncbi:MAG: 4Fe-4S binding protein [Deltaproteobacteria bacterium]|nr:MAG: 4Fe-4S binding protein [Deltaproteobacteria bacterium]